MTDYCGYFRNNKKYYSTNPMNAFIEKAVNNLSDENKQELLGTLKKLINNFSQYKRA